MATPVQHRHMAPDPTFVVDHEGEPGEHLLVGLAGPGVAGLTAVDYLVEHVGATRTGHVASRNLADITPFSDGEPRRPVRLYDLDGADVTVLLSEVSVPVWAADAFATAVAEWVSETDVADVTVLHGGTFPHSEEQHALFHVATDAYRDRRLDGDVAPLPGGFFDGAVAELLTRALDGDLPPTGVLVTPGHEPGPDLDAALLLLDGAESVLGLDVDETELTERSEQMRQYYSALAERMETLQEGDQLGGREFGEDRMYM